MDEKAADKDHFSYLIGQLRRSIETVQSGEKVYGAITDTGNRINAIENLLGLSVQIALAAEQVVAEMRFKIDKLEERVETIQNDIEPPMQMMAEEKSPPPRQNWYMGVDVDQLQKELLDTTGWSDRNQLLIDALYKASKRH